MGTTDIVLERIFRQLIGGNVGMVIVEAQTYLAAWPNPQTKEKLDELQKSYNLMEDYWRQGVKDPHLAEQYQRLLQRVYVLCANIAIHRHISASSYLQGLSNLVRQSGTRWSLEDIRQQMVDFVTDVAMLELEPEHQRKEKQTAVYKEHQQQMNALFNFIVTSHVWTDGVGRVMQDILLSPMVDTNDQQLVVSAISLSLMNRFDMVKFRLLVDVYQQSQDEAVRQRALVGWVLGIDDDFINVYPEQLELINQLLQSKRICRELVELQIQLIYTANAEKDSTAIQKEIMPDLLRNNSFRMTANGLEEIEEDSLEDVLHPDAAEQRMEKLESTFQRMQDMQKQGVDVYFGGFSQMKRFPFFYDMSNWLVPFFLQHPDIAQYVQKMENNSFLKWIAKGVPFCNSDKYSFVMAFLQVAEQIPANIREMLSRGEVQLRELDMDEQHSPAYIRKLYLMDLYRFFRLFPNRSALCNPFDTTKREMGMCLFITSKLFIGTPLEEHKREVVSVLLKHHMKKTADSLLDSFPEGMRDVQYFLWTGEYSQALALDPDNERALVGNARRAFDVGVFEDALNSYERLLLLHPEKNVYKLNKAICLVSMGEYEDALQILYQLNYEDPDNVRIIRALAWAQTCDGKWEQADKHYQRLISMENPTADDFLNRGYCLWLQGRVMEAADSFKRYIKDCNLTEGFQFWESELLSAHGITDTDVKMMQTLIAR